MRESRAVMLWPQGASGWTVFRENGVTYSLDVTKCESRSRQATPRVAARQGATTRQNSVEPG